MRVKVPENLTETFVGFVDHIRRRPGDVFTIPDEPRRELFPAEKKATMSNHDMKLLYGRIKDAEGKVPQSFSFKWMVPVSDDTPERVTTAQQALDQRADIIREEKAASREADVL